MRRFVTCSILALCVATPSFGQDFGSQDIFERPELTDLEGQNVDANANLLEALRIAAQSPASFMTSKSTVRIEAKTGVMGQASFQLRNTGGLPGKVFGINSVGSFPGFTVDDDCPEELDRSGGYCTIEMTFLSDTAKNLSTALVIGVEGENQTSIQVPVEIVISEPPKPIEPEVVVAPPTVTYEPVDLTPVAPTSQDIARRYFGSMGGMMPATPSNQKGFSIVSAPAAAKTPDFAGVEYDQMHVELISTQDRYDKDIPYTDASLPVDRDKILTSDRVIKAVLETPVSNVMCGKVVALVESDVYSATSRTPLIAAGSRVIGECGEFVGKRAGVSWNRIITTDGRSITFDLKADTRDASGVNGAVGHTYSSSFDRYGLPIISTMIDATAGVIMAVFGEDEAVYVDDNGNTVSETSAKNEGIRIVTGEARGTAQQIITDIRDVRKISVIPKGSRIDIEISEDIYFADDRKVVRLADMTFDLDDIEVGAASRELPTNLTLVPAAPGYTGPSILVAGRLYKVEETVELDDNGDVIEPLKPRLTLDELTGAEELKP